MATREEAVAKAASYIGTGETPPGSNRTIFAAISGHANGYAWCATFVTAVMRGVGIKLPSESAYTVAMDNGFRAAGAHVDNLATSLLPGDVVFFDFVSPFNSRGIQHVGIFVKYLDGGNIETIEGNTSSGSSGSQDNGDGVYRRVRPLKYIVSAGRPAYEVAHVPPPPPVIEVSNILPDYNPPIIMPRIIASLGAPNGGVWLLGEHGEIYAFWAKDLDAPNRHDYWNNRVAANLVPSANGYGYKVIATDGAEYNYDGPVEGHPADNQRKFDPPIIMPKIVSGAGAHNGGVRLLGEHGELYAFSAADHDAPNRHPEYWGPERLAAKIFNIEGQDGYVITDTTGSNYAYNG